MADNAPNTPPPGLTQEQLDAWVNEQMAAKVNNMLTARLATFEKKVTGTITESIGKTLEEKLQGLRAPKPEDEPDKPGDPDGNKGKTKSELAAVRAELNAFRARFEEEQREKQVLLARQREMTLRQETSRVLNGAGIVGDRFEAAYALLVQSGKIHMDEDPSSLDAKYNDPMAGGDIPLEAGLAAWLKTDVAKIFLPANGVRGSGGARPGGTTTEKRPLTDDERKRLIAEHLVNELGK